MRPRFFAVLVTAILASLGAAFDSENVFQPTPTARNASLTHSVAQPAFDRCLFCSPGISNRFDRETVWH
jgi:hypothetical protein